MGLFSRLFGGGAKKPDAPIMGDHDAGRPIGIVNTEATRPIAAAASTSKFRPGQVWAVKSLPSHPDARLIILRIEEGGKVGRIVHIALSGVSYGDGHTSIPHLPFAESAVQQSVATLEGEAELIPDFAEGYRLWREAFDAGKGGVFNISVADAFETVTAAVREHKM